MTQRWAAIGTGTISRSVVPDFAECPGADVVIVHSRDAAKAEAFAGEFGIPDFTDDFEAILEDERIDAIYLGTPFAAHFAMAQRALEAGKHVLVEKPMAMNADEVAELFEIAAGKQQFLMEAMWMKFNPAFQRLMTDLAGGLIGEPRSLRASFGIPFPDDGGSKWDVTRSGGALLDQGIYPVALAHAIFGPPDSLHAVGTLRNDGLDVAEHFTLEYSGARFAQAAASMAEFADPSATVSGTRGWISIPAPFWYSTDLEVHAGSAEAMFVSPERVHYEREGNGYVPMLREVIGAISAGAREHRIHPADDTVEIFRILDEVRREVVDGPLTIGGGTRGEAPGARR